MKSFRGLQVSLTQASLLLLQLDTLGLERNNQLEGTIPSEMGNMEALEIFNMDYNMFSGSIPAALSNLSNIRNWNLSFNDIEGTVPTGICELPHLESLAVDCEDVACDCCEPCR